MWRAFHAMVARLAWHGGYASRVQMSDTDSWSLSLDRRLNLIERHEQKQFIKTGLSEAPISSHLSRNIASAYLKAFCPFLDFSSITSESHVYQCLIKGNPRLERAHKLLAGQRKSSQFYFKDELQNKFVTAFFSTSPKQYTVVNKTNKAEILKAKGIKRSLTKKTITPSHFFKATIGDQVSHSVKQFSLKRAKNTIFLVQSKRRILSCFTVKRLFSKKTFQADCAFGYPLHLKKYLEV